MVLLQFVPVQPCQTVYYAPQVFCAPPPPAPLHQPQPVRPPSLRQQVYNVYGAAGYGDSAGVCNNGEAHSGLAPLQDEQLDDDVVGEELDDSLSTLYALGADLFGPETLPSHENPADGICAHGDGGDLMSEEEEDQVEQPPTLLMQGQHGQVPKESAPPQVAEPSKPSTDPEEDEQEEKVGSVCVLLSDFRCHTLCEVLKACWEQFIVLRN